MVIDSAEIDGRSSTITAGLVDNCWVRSIAFDPDGCWLASGSSLCTACSERKEVERKRAQVADNQHVSNTGHVWNDGHVRCWRPGRCHTIGSTHP